MSLSTLQRSRDFLVNGDLILARKAEDKALLLHSKSLSTTNYISEKKESEI